MMVKVRFAPSPTGNLHIGGARTALFNWLFARSQQGVFVLRIEDTDQLRSQKVFLDEILGSLEWLGLRWDELYHQSDYFDRYREHAQRLLDEGKAYRERSEKGEAVVLRVPQKRIVMRDEIRQEISFDTALIKDQVLIKSDGSPTYNFACVVDDASMGITHVIRGDDHISNTPKQVLLYEALGFGVPKFAHLPLIMGMGGGRLSKRTGATAISEFRQQGYWPAALLNYLLLLSWSPGEDREIVDIDEAVRLFSLGAVNKTAATFDVDKLNWMNNQYLKSLDAGRLTEYMLPRLAEKGFIDPDNFDRNYLVSLVQLFQGRINTLEDFYSWADFFFLDDYPVDPAAREKYLSHDLSKEFSLFSGRLAELEPFTVEGIEEEFRILVAELGMKSRELIHPVRVALTGRTIGPGLFEVIFHLGRQRTMERLSRFVKKEGVV